MFEKQFRDTEPMTQIRTDDPHGAPLVKISREIPLPWLLAGVAAFIFNTAQSWQATTNLDKSLNLQNNILEKLADKIEQTNGLVIRDGGIRAQNDAAHDFQIASLTQRIVALEALYPRIGVTVPVAPVVQPLGRR